MSWEEFEELLAAKRESAPGPDGLPYSVHRCAGKYGSKFLFVANRVKESAPPAGFGANRTVLIPETDEVHAEGLLIRSPESLRPLTLCSCDCKILTSAMRAGLKQFSS